MFQDLGHIIAQQFNQLTIADFKDYQVAWPTLTRYHQRNLFAATVEVPERVYASIGWLHDGNQVAARLQGLEMASVTPEGCPFQLHQRIGAAIPMSFEAISTIALPHRISLQAAFTGAMPGSVNTFHTVFQRVKPRFVRVYDFASTSQLDDMVRRLMQEEAAFVVRNQVQLQLIPFYKEQFSL